MACSMWPVEAEDVDLLLRLKVGASSLRQAKITADAARRKLTMKTSAADDDDEGEDYGLPDFHTRFINDEDLCQFGKALNAPEALSLVALNDWRPIHQRQWKKAAKSLDEFLGNDKWKEADEYAYYNSTTVSTVLRDQVERGGTDDLVQAFSDEAHASLKLVLESQELSDERKRSLFRHLDLNFGRAVLCLSGGATFAYYHFGVIKALLDNGVLPDIISGTSGGALVAGLVATRTDEELKKLLVPELAHKITACQDGMSTWLARWWRTGARFDVMEWAEQCSWFCRGSTTFREAYERTGRILNVSCVPSDPHSPTILANYLTSPNCVIWSAVLASAAVPGILNPVVLMMKKPDGTLSPYSFGHKWKDGSLRTDIPLKALDVNPHISLFFFSSRGSVGRPVTHRRGRGWRGGFLGSALEQYIKLDLNKWLKVLRHLELLPRPLGQDWSEIWLQRFSGTVTIWPKSVIWDLYYILSDPSPQRLARMLHEGQQSTFPKIKFIANRMKIEKVIAEGLARDPDWAGGVGPKAVPARSRPDQLFSDEEDAQQRTVDLLTDSANQPSDTDSRKQDSSFKGLRRPPVPKRRSSVMEELRRQSAVFFDDTDDTFPSEDERCRYQGQSSGTKVG
ncbi:hypothetical protein UREG_06652 [Uncinocarpus reesii 1704]|uniref:PNPLA domain-containing protein n=1 Tax=Uncinocarpus reesii (strain UAMH 1704) TaxID=336963 RepID=C4JVR0_UNCRE|nr:uncharacterized protein UREG_06652 [Uncinocarpus reesii 1704]EEP81787.1 hypothetical protein UREG_06652 [Uncinocarpus reesii 1704]